MIDRMMNAGIKVRAGIRARRTISFRLAAAASIALFTIGAAPNWNVSVIKTAGGHRVGNPDAKVKLVAFESYTCSHCRDFQLQSDGHLRLEYIHPGKLSLEIRNFVRDPVDLTAALLANCGSPDKFFGNHHAILSQQNAWMAKLDSVNKAQKDRWYSGAMAARRRAIASDLQFYELMIQRGYRRTDLDRCLANDTLATALAEQTQADDDKYKLTGTPNFLINGIRLAGTTNWELLKPQIDARL